MRCRRVPLAGLRRARGRGTEAQQQREVEVRHHVRTHHGKGLVTEQGQGMDDAAGGFKRRLTLLAVAHRLPPPGSLADGGANLRTAIGKVDHDVVEAGGGEPAQMPLDERFRAEREQRFGPFGAEPPHPLAAPGGQQHDFHARLRGREARGKRALAGRVSTDGLESDSLKG